MADKVNPLGLYEPFETKALAINRSGAPERRTADPVLSFGRDFHLWNNWWSQNAEGCGIDYAAHTDPASSSLVLSAVRWAGNTLPEAPLMVKEPGEEEGESEEVKGHRLVELLRYPNPYYAGDSLWTAFAYSWIINGNVYFLKIRNSDTRLTSRGEVAELWYEPHWNVRVVAGESNRDYVRGYEFKRGNDWQFHPAENVVHFRDGLDPANPRYGLSFIGSILRELYGDQEAANFAARLAGGGGVPPWVMTIDPQITGFTRTDAEALEEILHEKTSGRKRGRPAVVYGGKAERLGFTPREMDVAVLRRLPEERFCAVVGIPPEALLLGAGREHPTYNNMSTAIEAAYEAYLIPLQRKIAGQLNLQLLPDFEGAGSTRYVTHDLSKVRALQEDEDAIHKRFKEALLAGGITLNEFRSKIGMPEAPDGDVYFIPSTVQVVKEGELGKEPELPPDGGNLLPEGDEEREGLIA
jgi:HK97 family phage portal protein